MPRTKRTRTKRWFRDPVKVVAALVLAVGVTLAGVWCWDYFGTSWFANRNVAEQLHAFRAGHPLTDGVAELRTDFDNAPVSTPRVLWVPSWAGTNGAWGGTIDARTPIREGVTTAALDSGAAGHFPQSQQVGQIGNFALAGHRRAWGDSFLHIDDLNTRDIVAVETADAWFVYEVEVPRRIVRPDQGAEVIAVAPAGLPAGGRYLTLTSCHSLAKGAWGNDHRMAVHAAIVGWAPHDAGIPAALKDVAG